MQYAGAVKPSRLSYAESKSPRAACCPKDASLSPPKRKRSKSPLRQDRPSDVFQRSPRSHRHMYQEDDISGDKHETIAEPRQEKQPRSTDTEACLAWLNKNCFKEVIHLERTLEEHKMALANQTDFNLPEAFGFFSKNQLARLSQFDIVHGLQQLGIKAEETDAMLLKERYDAD